MSSTDKIKAALSRIEDGLGAIDTDEDWLKFLRFQSSFYQYSFGNAILIFLQNPNASYVAGYRAWNKLGRFVKKGSKGLAILAPCIRKVEVFKEPADKSEYHDEEAEKETMKVVSGFRIVYVYDIADTDGSDEYIPVLVKGLAGNGDSEKAIYERLVSVISREYRINEATGTSSKGSYNLETGVITVRSDLEYLQKVKTLLHEVSHAFDFAMNPDESVPRNRRELIAESSAFVVSTRLGLDTSAYSLSYIQSWLRDKKELKVIADSVQKVAYRIIKMLAESSDSAFADLTEGMADEQG